VLLCPCHSFLAKCYPHWHSNFPKGGIHVEYGRDY
jgi:hypothetical protein